MPGMCCKSNGLALQGFPEKAMNKLEDFGFIQSRPKGEYHANNQQMSKLLHKAIGLGNKGAAPQVLAQAHPCRASQCCVFPQPHGTALLSNTLHAGHAGKQSSYTGLCAKCVGKLMWKPQCS